MNNTPSNPSLELLDMDQVKVDPKWALRIPGNLALRRKLLPFSQQGNHVLVACNDPQDYQGLQAVERYCEVPVLASPAESQSLDRAIHKIFRDPIHAVANNGVPSRISFADDSEELDTQGQEIVALGDEIFHAAFIRGATDIHIEPSQNDVAVRLRVDGRLEEYRRIPIAIHASLTSRLKVLSGMDIAERRAPQDGRFTLGREDTQLVDVRAATIPTKQGERMTLRLLASQTHELTLEKLGMSGPDLRLFENAIQRPHGLILLTGPTGCGKSTTLYAAIRKLIEHRMLNIITIEDPVEYVIDGVSQVEVDAAEKISFHKALRSALRHDPDVLMIGEIRDELSAEIAIKAALTGHLVFTTLHTNSAASSITRLVDMKIQPFLVGAVSRLFMAQRLVRKICSHCRQPTKMTAAQAKILGQPNLEGTTMFEPGGCRYCAQSGYNGRTGVFEMLPFDRELANLASQGASELEIVQHSRIHQLPSLFHDALAKLENGTTSFEEIVGVTNLI